MLMDYVELDNLWGLCFAITVIVLEARADSGARGLEQKGDVFGRLKIFEMKKVTFTLIFLMNIIYGK